MKLLFIGARLFDDVVEYVHSMGITSVLSESNPQAPNLKLADSVHIVSRGMQGPIDIALKEDVDAVLPLIGIDDPLREVAQMKDELEKNYGIPVVASNTSSTNISTSKKNTKQFFTKNNINTPDYDFIKRDTLKNIPPTDVNENNNLKNTPNLQKSIEVDDKRSIEKIKLPVVLKQSEGQGGRGIAVATQVTDVENYFQEYESALVEQFIQGFEISVEVLSWRGDSIPLVAVSKGNTTIEGIHPLDKVKSAPAQISGLDNDFVLEMAHKITKLLGSEANTDVDMIFDPLSKDLYALEMNTRPSGTRYLTTAATGINPLHEMVNMALGEWKSKNVKTSIKSYSALEVPVRTYEGPKSDLQSKNFQGKNSWVVHGPQNYERVTIRGENKTKVFKLAEKLKINLSSYSP